MPTFSYEALRGPGTSISGEIDAQDERTAITTLVNRGYHVVQIKSADDQRNTFRFGIGGLKRRDLARFTRDLAYLLKAGLPLASALANIQERYAEAKWRTIASGIRSRLEDGQTFSAALGAYPRVFDDMYASLVRAGEESGAMGEVLKRLAALTEQRNETRNRIQMAMVYPAVMLVLGCLTVLVLVTFVVPRFAKVFQDTGQALPLPTELLIQTSSALQEYWYIVLAIIVLTPILGLRFARTNPGRAMFDAILFRIPVLRTVLHGSEVAAFAQTLGALLQNSIPITKALRITAATLRATRYQEAVRRMANEVHEGKTLSGTLREAQLFPASLASVVAVGEESSTLSESLLQAAEEAEYDTARQLKILMTLLEPVMIVVVGLAVGYIVAAMILPIFDLGGAIQ